MNLFDDWLKRIERLVVILAAGLAAFPLYQYWAEADDRFRERAVREAQLVAHCETNEKRIENISKAFDELKKGGSSDEAIGDLLAREFGTGWLLRLAIACNDVDHLSNDSFKTLLKLGVFGRNRPKQY